MTPQSNISYDEDSIIETNSRPSANTNSPQFATRLKKIVVDNRQKPETVQKSNFHKKAQLENIYKLADQNGPKDPSKKLGRSFDPSQLQQTPRSFQTHVIQVHAPAKRGSKQLSPVNFQKQMNNMVYTFNSDSSQSTPQKNLDQPLKWAEQINKLLQIPHQVLKNQSGGESPS